MLIACGTPKILQIFPHLPLITAYAWSTLDLLVGLGVSVSILHGPESMLQHCTQKFTWLLILWQLLLPSGAPWLHSVVDGSCCASSGVENAPPTCSCRHHSERSHAHDSGHGPGSSDSKESDQKPHDCSNCAICQSIAAPRVLAVLIELPKIAEQTSVIETPECADPLLGFCQPLQCRAPPAA